MTRRLNIPGGGTPENPVTAHRPDIAAWVEVETWLREEAGRFKPAEIQPELQGVVQELKNLLLTLANRARDRATEAFREGKP